MVKRMLVCFFAPSRPFAETLREQVKLALDLNLHYLRHVFHTCYYCTSSFNFTEELGDVCGRHLRYAAGSHVSIRDEAGELRSSTRGT